MDKCYAEIDVKITGTWNGTRKDFHEQHPNPCYLAANTNDMLNWTGPLL
ncbi:hypothetical protein [Streptomyces sp. NPDC059874]